MINLFEMLQQTPLQSLASACYDDALFFKGVLLKSTQTLGSAKNELDTLDSFSKMFYEDIVLENTQALGSPKMDWIPCALFMLTGLIRCANLTTNTICPCPIKKSYLR